MRRFGARRNDFGRGSRFRFPLRGAMLKLLRLPVLGRNRVENARHPARSGVAMLMSPMLFIVLQGAFPLWDTVVLTKREDHCHCS